MSEEYSGIPDFIYEKAERDSGYAIAAGLFAIAKQLELLGNGEASTGPTGARFGALELLGMELKEQLARSTTEITDALQNVYVNENGELVAEPRGWE